MKTVRFLNDKKLPYKTNAVVQFQDDVADAIIATGNAVLYSPSPFTPYVPPAAGQSPVTNAGHGSGSGNPLLDAQVQQLTLRLNSIDYNRNGTADTTDDIQNHVTNYVSHFTNGLLP
jgi:hypothetical protein